MDLWVVAAAAGVGYIAKYWQNLSRDKEGLSQSFSGDSIGEKLESQPLLQQLRDSTFPFQKQLGIDGSSSREEVSNSDRRFSETTLLSGASAKEMASISGFNDEGSMHLGKYGDYNVLSLSSFPPGDHLEKGDGIKGKSESGDFLSSELSTRERGFSYGSGRGRSSLRSKPSYGYSVKPLSSLESCLIAQLYKNHVEMEEYVFSSLPSPSMLTVRPLFVTDGNQIISRASDNSYSGRFGNGENKVHKEDDVYSEEKETVLGIPSLPEIGSVELSSKLKQNKGKRRLGRLSSSNSRVSPKHFQSQGSPNGMLLFCIGVTIGVMSTIISNKKEVHKLNELLKQTENLVQDLQEELEMKDSLTVKELVNEDYESQETNGISFHNRAPAAFFPEQELAESTKCDGREPQDQKEDENSESMSKIEAELEAELERLELNMNVSSLEGRLSGLVELDPEFVADFAQGELRADMTNRRSGELDDSDQDVSGTSTQTHTANYAVSPRELSLRLHEVIQSRLEERIRELETTLQQSRQRVHLMEPEQREFSNSASGSSSTHSSPIMMEDSDNVARPLVLNLAGEALAAYNEAYEELTRIARPEEEDLLSTLKESLFGGQNANGENGSMPHLKIIEERRSRNLVHDKIRTWEERISTSRGSNEVGESEDEEDDEIGKLLIKQIVEKTRQGSPVVLNAQRMLVSMNEKTSLE